MFLPAILLKRGIPFRCGKRLALEYRHSIHLNKKVALFDWRLVFHVWLPVCSGGRLLLGGAVCTTVVVESSVPSPHSQDLSWCVIWFVLSVIHVEITR